LAQIAEIQDCNRSAIHQPANFMLRHSSAFDLDQALHPATT
jgi:hypothetical protein